MMFKHGAGKGEDKEKKKKEDERKERERAKTEKKEKEKEDRKRSATAAPSGPAKPKDAPPEKLTERSLSGNNLASSPPRSATPPPGNAVSPRMGSPSSSSPLGGSLEITIEKEDSLTELVQPQPPSQRHSPIIYEKPTTPTHSNNIPTPHLVAPGLPSSPSLVSELTKSGSKGLQDQTNVLKSKIAALPPDTKQLVEYLLNIFSRAVPPGWNVPANVEAPSLEGQIDTTIDKLVEASEILFNKDTQSMLKRYAKELRETPNRRVDKWKVITNLIEDPSSNFVNLFLGSDALEAIITSALARPLEQDEAEVLLELFKSSLIREIAQKELLAVVQASSHSNAHVSEPFEENKPLADAVIELVVSFRKLLSSPEEEVIVQDLATKKDSEVSDATNQSVALLQHANTIKHAKSGSDIIHPLERYFKRQIEHEVKQGEKWQVTIQQAKAEKESKLKDIDEFVTEEESKLLAVQTDITDLETRLDQKRTEEKRLQASLEQKLAEREAYQKQCEQTDKELRAQVEEAALHLEHHRKSEESSFKFAQDVSTILDREVNETLKKTKEVLQELDKEVSFLEEKMVTYERSISLFNAADEPEVLVGLKKLFERSVAIYNESRQSSSRVAGVVELLQNVLGKKSSQLEDLRTNLDKIVSRQNALNTKYKLQRD